MSWNDDGGFDHTKDREPLFLWQGHPVYAAPFLVGLHVVCMLLCVVATASGWMRFFEALMFSSRHVRDGWLWQPFTYGFVHAPAGAIWFAVEMLLLWQFGREVERFFGRRSFLRLYVILWLLIPALLLLLSVLGPQAMAGSSTVHFGIFIAFATVYPNVPIFWTVSAKWVAVILTAAYACIDIAYLDLTGLMLLAASVSVAWGYVRWERGYLTIPQFRRPSFRPKPKLRVLPRPDPTPSRRSAPAEPSPMDDVDALLDKIARSGLESLSPAERAKLERASADLKKSRE